MTSFASVNTRVGRSPRAATATLLLIVAGAIAHGLFLIMACPLDLSGDEAHYWEWSRRLDLSYYSKGPLIAYIIAGGRLLLADWSIRMVGTEVLAVRLPAIALSALTSVGLYVLTRNTLRSSWAGFAAVASLLTIPMMVAGSFLMTIDAPLIACWTWALVVIDRALQSQRVTYWLAAGVLIAIGILAKYTMVLIAPVVLFVLLVVPEWRSALRRPGIYLCAAIGLTGFVPILLWNAQHAWVSFRHVAGQAGVSGGTGFLLFGPLEYIAGQALVLNPFWLLLLGPAIRDWTRNPAQKTDEPPSEKSIRFLLVAAIVPWLFFAPFSVVTKIQPNWPAPAVVSAIPLVVGWVRRRGEAERWRAKYLKILVAGAVTGVLAGVMLHQTELLTPVWRLAARFAPAWDMTPAAKFDPTSRLRGWSKLAAVDELLAHEMALGRDPFIMTDDYQLASQIAFYCPSHPQVFCAQSALGKRQSQYDIWPNPIRDAALFVGRPCIYVGQLDSRITGGAGSRAALPHLRKIATIEYFMRDLRYQVWPVFVCDAFAGFSDDPGNRPRF